jgi:hypothetical protein
VLFRSYLILTLPQSVMIFFLDLKFPMLKKISFLKTIALKNIKPIVSDEHHWEIGMRLYAAERIDSEICKNFKIITSYSIPENPNSKLYLLKKL